MRCRLFGSVVTFALGIVTLSSVAMGQGSSANDVVRYRDKKKDGQETSIRGELVESVKGITVKAGNKTLAEIAPSEIVSVEYHKLGNLDTFTLRLTEQRDFTKARTDYQTAYKNANDPKVRKFLEFKDAMLSAKVADSRANAEEFTTEATAAIEKLLTFVRAHPDSWEIWPTGHAAARLQAELGKFSDAANTFALLARTKDLPPDLVLLAKLEEVEALVRSGNSIAASPAVSGLAANPAFPKSGPLAEKLQICAAVLKGLQSSEDSNSIKTIRGIIEKTNDTSVRASGHTALAELLISRNRFRDAMWEYLWVETVYNQEWEDRVNAVHRLITVFERLGDKDRAQIYRDKLPRVKLGL